VTAFLGLRGGHVTARDYYEASAPPLTVLDTEPVSSHLARTGRPVEIDGPAEAVPTFTRSSIGQGGAQLYSGSIATVTPQAFTVASPPMELNGFGVDPTVGEVVHCRPAHIRQVGAGFAVTELPALVRSRCTF
jgi:hypothetical protein